MMPPWVDVAEAKLGQHEIAGAGDNSFIVECLRRRGLPPDMLHDETAWCGAFAAYCMEEAGLRAPKGAAGASNWLKHPETILTLGRNNFRPGCIAVFHRPGGAHVAFALAETKRYVVILGGNQGNTVGVQARPKALLESYAWPVGVP